MKIIDLINNSSNDKSLKIGFLGQSGYVLKKKNFTILIDPYLSDYIENPNGENNQKMKRNFPPVINPSEVDSVNAVFCTHSHLDHMDPWTLKKIIPKTTINPSVDLIIIPVILALPELVFLINCI